MVGKWQTTVAGSAIALAFGVAMATGVFFGLYPAYKASQRDPIQARRHE
jgi:putative ABC transport system permease protein